MHAGKQASANAMNEQLLHLRSQDAIQIFCVHAPNVHTGTIYCCA